MSILLKKPYQLHIVYGNQFVYPQRVAVRQCSKKNSTGKWIVAKTPEGVREIPFDFFVTNSVLATEALTNSDANADKVKNRKELWEKREQLLNKSHEDFVEKKARKKRGTKRKPNVIKLKRKRKKQVHHDVCVKEWPRISPDFQAALPDLNPDRYEGVSFASISNEMDTLLVSLKARLQEVH